MPNRRFEMHQYRQVIVRMRLGDTDRGIANLGLMGRKKAAEVRSLAQRHGWLDLDQPLPEEEVLAQALSSSRTRPQTPSQVLPHREDVEQWRQDGIRGTAIHQALIRKHGFTGSYSSVRRFLQAYDQKHPEVTTILDFEPGDTAQVDFGRGPEITDVQTGEIISTWIFVMVLAWSRHMYAEMVRDQKVATWLGCHRRAFEALGGVPVRVVLDNLKSAITKACYYDPEVQRSYAECAEGYGFLIAPHPPREPQMKGRVESGVKYVRKTFLPLRHFRSLSDGNHQLSEWVMGVAGNRIHGTTRQRPLTQFVETERYLLKPLPDRPPELVVWKKVKVHADGHVQYDYCLYSVPYTLVPQSLWLRAAETTVRCFRDHELAAIHPRLYRHGSRSTLDEHLPPEALAHKMRTPQWCLSQAQEIGPGCRELIETLFAHRVIDNLRAAQGVIGLSKKYGNQRLEAACQRALAHDSALYRTVKTILDKGLDQQPSEPAPTPLQAPYTGQGRFCRATAELFNFPNTN